MLYPDIYLRKLEIAVKKMVWFSYPSNNGLARFIFSVGGSHPPQINPMLRTNGYLRLNTAPREPLLSTLKGCILCKDDDRILHSAPLTASSVWSVSQNNCLAVSHSVEPSER